MYLAILVIIGVSFALQVAAAVLAVRLIRVTGTSWAWLAIAAAVSAMAVRRAMLLAFLLADTTALKPSEYWGEAVGLLNAVLMLAGIAAIGPLFRTVQDAQEAMEQSHDRLENEVGRQTSQIVASNEQLKMEVVRRTEAEAALRQEHRHLSNVLAIYEKDRQLVAYEIHDGFVQTAVAASMGLQAALASHPDEPARAMEQARTALHFLQQSLSQARSLVRGLRPSALEESGLVAAIEELVHDTQSSSNVCIEWSPRVPLERLSPAVEISIFRIVQEGLTNAVRHSSSPRVAIGIQQSNGAIHLRIEDWGSGFDPDAPKAGHYGLEGIRERARLFGGAARIDSAPGKGTRIEVDLPAGDRAL